MDPEQKANLEVTLEAAQEKLVDAKRDAGEVSLSLYPTAAQRVRLIDRMVRCVLRIPFKYVYVTIYIVFEYKLST